MRRGRNAHGAFQGLFQGKGLQTNRVACTSRTSIILGFLLHGNYAELRIVVLRMRALRANRHPLQYMPKRRWFPYESRSPFETEGVNEAWLVNHFSIGRECSVDSPYLIPNEWIAGNIAHFLRLPIPPFALVRNDPSRAGMFASLRFGRKEMPPSDMRPGPCVKNDPDLCTGILLFDILVANGDRHRGTLKVDDPLDPKEFNIFDHDRALLYIEDGKGAKRLFDGTNALGVSRGSVAGHSEHCLLAALESSNYFDQWVDRIAAIPKWFIEDICHEVNDWLKQDEMDAVVEFLNFRKQELRTIIKNHKNRFAVKNWGLLYE
jgi:hypothetical protein